MQCSVTWSPETGTGLVKPYQPQVSKYNRGPGWKDKIMEDEERRERRRKQREKVVSCCKKFAAFLFSHIGLAAMVVAYSIAGGFLFKALEAPHERTLKLRVIGEREDCIERILNDAVDMKLNDDGGRINFTAKVRGILLSYQTEVVSAVKDSGWDGSDDTDMSALQWSFAGALLYAVTVITTIGYGHVAPKTTWGRLVTILYALVGIPLTFLYLSNIGNFLADCFRLFYKKVCCDICCCQQCERKKKQERLRLRRRRELAAQRNVSMNDPASVTRYGTHDETMTITADQTEYYMDENEVLGLPGGDENLAYEEGPLDSETDTPADSQEVLVPSHNRKPDSNNLRETAILGDSDSEDIRETAILDDDYVDNIRETAILDDDDDEELSKSPPPRKHSSKKKKKASSPSGDIHVSSGILDKLGNARETDILDDSDEEVLKNASTLSPEGLQTKSLSDSQLKKSASFKKNKEDMKRTKSLKDKSKTKIKDSKKNRNKDSNERSRSRSVEHNKAAAMEDHSRKPSKKEKNKKDNKDNKDTKPQSKDKDLKRDGSRKGAHKVEDEEDCPANSSHSRSNSKKGKGGLERNKSSKQSKLFRKGTFGRKKDPKDSGDDKISGTRNTSSIRRKNSTKRKKSSSDTEDDEEDGRLRNKSFHQSDESFVTAQGDSLSQICRTISDAETDDEYDDDDDDDDYDEGFQSGRGYSKTTFSPHDGVVEYDTDYDMELMEFGGQYGDDPFEYEAHTDEEKVTVPISICLIIIAGYIFGGSVLFTLWEDWDYLTGSYFCFITLSTIGFGDIVPGTDMKEWSSHSKLVSCSLWLAFGLSLLAMCFNLMQEEVKEKCKWLGLKLGILKDESEV